MEFRTREKKEISERVECLGCTEKFMAHNVVTTDCFHSYCMECVQEMFANAIKGATRFPPHCCQQDIPITSVERFLTPEMLKSFDSKSLEDRTENRIFCPVPKCSEFIPPTGEEGRYPATIQCPKCKQEVCSACKTYAHDGNCGEARDVDILDYAKKMGYKRCVCGYLVEKNMGCNHMV